MFGVNPDVEHCPSDSRRVDVENPSRRVRLYRHARTPDAGGRQTVKADAVQQSAMFLRVGEAIQEFSERVHLWLIYLLFDVVTRGIPLLVPIALDRPNNRDQFSQESRIASRQRFSTLPFLDQPYKNIDVLLIPAVSGQNRHVVLPPIG